MSVTVKVDLSGLQRHYKTLEREARDHIDRVMTRAVQMAESKAEEVINAVIYSTPERGYKRTGALRDSIYAVKVRRGQDEWHLEVGALGSSKRAYALYNERGTYEGRVSLDTIMERAKKESWKTLIVLEYGDPAKGLEPRPWTIPTVVMMNRELQGLVEKAIQDAERASGERA